VTIAAVPDATTRLRLLRADVITDVRSLRETLEEVTPANDRTYIEREVDNIQAAAHRIVAFLDAIAGEPRN
jgi:hypothetical protein